PLLIAPFDSCGTRIEFEGGLIELGPDEGEIDMADPVPLWLPGETGDSIPEGPGPKDEGEIGYELDGAEDEEAALMNEELTGEERLINEDDREWPFPPAAL
ncbi:hypothetical protein BGZ75_010362, partial [Mortierella antarctica]